MAGLARLAKAQGHRVTGCDSQCYPPMTDQLTEAGIDWFEGYNPSDIPESPDCFVIGNAISRGNPMLEFILDEGLAYTSGPAWLGEHVLAGRHVIAVAGTHGKTTTSAILVYLLEQLGLAPGYLVGGVMQDFPHSADLGRGDFFVIEADEYDTAFFDKRSKFLHYRPRSLLLNNLEYDHADIFPDLAAIERQFHHLLRTVPRNGFILAADDDPNLTAVIEQGCWTPLSTFSLSSGEWSVQLDEADGSVFRVLHRGKAQGQVNWSLIGEHNVRNALAALAMAFQCGCDLEKAIKVLSNFAGVKRRMQLRGQVDGVRVYDDFAHHPTAIQTTLEGLRHRVGDGRLLAVLEFGSNSMRRGVHDEQMQSALKAADMVFFARSNEALDSITWLEQFEQPVYLFQDVNEIVQAVASHAASGDHILIMSNKGFDNIHEKLLQQLETR